MTEWELEQRRRRRAAAPATRPAGRRARRRRGRLPLRALFLVGLACLVGGLLLHRLLPRHYVVALDAGHGGGDPGAMGLIPETQLTETTVRYLEELLERDQNFTPVLCHEYGQGAEIEERARAARWHGADLLLSVHGNSEPGGAASGFECYPAPPGRTYHEESMRFARRLTAQVSAAGAQLRGEGGIRFAYYRLQPDGEYLKEIVEASDTSFCADPSFGVLEKPGCPAVLAEQCFITNEGDVALFGSEEGCRLAAECYYRAICEYFRLPPTALEG